MIDKTSHMPIGLFSVPGQKILMETLDWGHDIRLMRVGFFALALRRVDLLMQPTNDSR
jgi:hypothetical protein